MTNESRVLALLALDRPDDAVALLADWRARPGADLKIVTRLEVRALREAGRFDAMEPVMAELRALSPADPAPFVYEIVQKAMAGLEAEATTALENYLFRFGGSALNLMLAAEPLAEIASLPLVQTCVAAAKERGYQMQRFSALLVQSNVQRGEWDAAGRALALLPPETGREGVQSQIWRAWMQRLVDAAGATTEPAPNALLELLRGRRWPIQVFRTSIEALLRAGRTEAARDVIALGASGFPASRWLQTQAVKVSADIAASPAPPSGAVTTAPWVFVEKLFVQRLDELLRLRQWDDAARLIREVRATRPAPSWLGAREARLHFAHVRIYQAQGNFAGIVASAQYYLNGEEDRARLLPDVAREFFREGDRGAAVGLAKVILSRSPRYLPAQRALSEWKPAPVETRGLLVDALKR